MSNTSSSPTTAIRAPSGGANPTAMATAAGGGGGVMMSMKGPSPPTPTTITTSHHDQQCPPTAAVIYPVASSGRGFLPKNHPCRPILPFHPHPHSQSFGNPRPSPPPPPIPHPSLKGIPPSLHPKAVSSPFSVSETKGHATARERTKDDSLVTVRNRKVRITDGASIYAPLPFMVEKWVPRRNPVSPIWRYFQVSSATFTCTGHGGFTKDTEDKEEQVEEDKKEDEQSVENLSTQDLLKRHIDRAKKVRSRLRQERLKRIVRYKTRLALLLPPLVEQFRSDTAAAVGN
ncbi:hypothetical protein V6N13_016318 [Hibiscus sabdariffa]